MPESLTPDIYWLTLTALMIALFWVPYVINRILEDGLWPALRNPNPDGRPKAAWAVRAEAAHRNAVENLVVFAPLALAVVMTGRADTVTALAGMIFFVSRAAHFLVYTAGIPVLRTLLFAAGFGAQVTLALRLLGVI
ncbi:MAG: MAPEG family protein [Pseudomonadota bacterium]